MKKIMSSSIEPFNSKSYLEIPKGMASDTIFARECNGIQCEDKLIHEHNFVPETIKKEIVLFNVLLAACATVIYVVKFWAKLKLILRFYGSTNYKRSTFWQKQCSITSFLK
jgi:hypothetical protein